MNDPEQFLVEHSKLIRRFFLGIGATCMAVGGDRSFARSTELSAPELVNVLDKLEPSFTPQADFQDVSRGKPLPHALLLARPHHLRHKHDPNSGLARIPV